MKKVFMIIAAMCMTSIMASAQKTIRVSTDKTDLVMQVSPKGRLYQVYLGDKLKNPSDYNHLKWDVYAASDGAVCQRGHEVYATSGAEDFFEPAVAVTHADGNMTTYLYYKSSEEKAIKGGTETIITLQDKVYPLTVKLHYAAYPKENVIKAWSEISHKEKAPVTLWRYSSTMLYFKANKYFVTNYHSDWAKEGQPETCQLTAGKKIVDTKLGTRAAMQEEPFFELGFDEPAKENEGKVMLGTIGWPGNFRFTFEVDNVGALRVIPAINPYASDYKLKAGETFTTPEFIFAMSDNGIGEASRNLHNWARQYQVNMGMEDRLTLLNNWENTGFDFNQQSLAELMKDAKDLGVDMFLLDDGWFANKYPRSGDHQGLGDWDETADKLPHGIGYLTEAAKKKGIKFGIWIEPEMVNPKSELYEKHKDWVIHLPNRDEYYFRNQLVLDLSNPKVQDYVFGVVDNLMTKYPDIAFFKWDCNSPITNIYSVYLKDKQSHLYIDYVRGLYNVLERVKAKYPDLPMMLCSGGGGRSDYEALSYFTEFWPSDNTDPIERLFIQWGFSQVFPAKTMCAHVTTWNKNSSVKFRTDVAMMCKLGFDIKLADMSKDDETYCRTAVQNYNRLKPVVLEGDMYRLVSPYGSNHTSTMYVGKDKDKAVVFAFDIHPRYAEKTLPVRLQGLDADKMYRVKEINLMPGANSSLSGNGEVFSGEFLMNVGLNLFTTQQLNSRVVEVVAE